MNLTKRQVPDEREEPAATIHENGATLFGRPERDCLRKTDSRTAGALPECATVAMKLLGAMTLLLVTSVACGSSSSKPGSIGGAGGQGDSAGSGAEGGAGGGGAGGHGGSAGSAGTG